jgi:hypothetical protein
MDPCPAGLLGDRREVLAPSHLQRAGATPRPVASSRNCPAPMTSNIVVDLITPRPGSALVPARAHDAAQVARCVHEGAAPTANAAPSARTPLAAASQAMRLRGLTALLPLSARHQEHGAARAYSAAEAPVLSEVLNKAYKRALGGGASLYLC